MLVHGAIYICNYEYIDKVTKRQVCKKVRYNDPDEFQSSQGLNLAPRNSAQPQLPIGADPAMQE